MILTCFYESLYVSIMNEILRAGFSNADQYSQLVNGPPPLIFEHCRLAWARIKEKSATNVSAREVGSRKKITPVCPGNSKPFILIFLFHSMNATIKIFA